MSERYRRSNNKSTYKKLGIVITLVTVLGGISKYYSVKRDVEKSKKQVSFLRKIF